MINLFDRCVAIRQQENKSVGESCVLSFMNIYHEIIRDKNNMRNPQCQNDIFRSDHGNLLLVTIWLDKLIIYSQSIKILAKKKLHAIASYIGRSQIRYE